MCTVRRESCTMYCIVRKAYFTINISSPVSEPLEVEPQLEYVVVELALETSLVAKLPLSVDDLEGDVLVGRPGADPEDAKVAVVGARGQSVRGSRRLLDKVRVEDVELVALCKW